MTVNLEQSKEKASGIRSVHIVTLSQKEYLPRYQPTLTGSRPLSAVPSARAYIQTGGWLGGL